MDKHSHTKINKLKNPHEPGLEYEANTHTYRYTINQFLAEQDSTPYYEKASSAGALSRLVSCLESGQVPIFIPWNN